MRRHPDINPGDLQHRRHLIRNLRNLREQLGCYQSEMAATMWVTFSAISRFERRDPPNPKISTIQRYARAITHTATLHLNAIPDCDLGEHGQLLQRLSQSTNPETADAAHRSLTLARLVAARRHLGIQQRDLATSIGVSASSLCDMEADNDDPLLSSYQRYARALGGQLTVRIGKEDFVDEVRVRRLVNEGAPVVLGKAEQVEAARLIARQGGDVGRRLNVSGATAARLVAAANEAAA